MEAFLGAMVGAGFGVFVGGLLLALVVGKFTSSAAPLSPENLARRVYRDNHSERPDVVDPDAVHSVPVNGEIEEDLETRTFTPYDGIQNGE